MTARSLAFLLVVLVLGTRAEEKKKTTGWLSVSTKPTGADLVVDGHYRGKTPLNRIELDAGKHVVKAFYPALAAWNASFKVDSVVVVEGFETTIDWEMESMVNLNSFPSGSFVYREGRILGVTPFLFKSSQGVSGMVVVQKEGFEPANITLVGSGYLARTVRLNRLDDREEWNFSDVLAADANGEKENQWLNYAAGSVMILSGVLAAHYKDIANREFDNYERTRNLESLNSVRRFDKLSAISFTFTQLSFGVLAYKLLLE
ncbi:MAG: PEGA domain-containing protein [Ignavibacteriales bacterium]|nr:PEGA domain-containing protein [Ignavibacteriales bacterium]